MTTTFSDRFCCRNESEVVRDHQQGVQKKLKFSGVTVSLSVRAVCESQRQQSDRPEFDFSFFYSNLLAAQSALCQVTHRSVQSALTLSDRFCCWCLLLGDDSGYRQYGTDGQRKRQEHTTGIRKHFLVATI